MDKPIILVTGSNGQLGQELQQLAPQFSNYHFIFTTRNELPFIDQALLLDKLQQIKPDYIINCAAYTAVDKAETDSDTAFLVNSIAVATLAEYCRSASCKMVHISTDYVFDGNSPVGYRETDAVNPVNTYGASKLRGEQLCIDKNPAAVIIRTAWVYSEFGNNFVKTMIRLMKERDSLNVVSDQVGAPTYAADLAIAIMHIIASPNWYPGIYHYSNSGKISWFDFASAIKTKTGSACIIHPVPGTSYPTPAKRPSFSLLDTSKIRETFNLMIPDWNSSLNLCISKLQQA